MWETSVRASEELLHLGGGNSDHPELGQQRDGQESQVEGDEAVAISLSQLEALGRHRKKRNNQAEAQGSC